MKIIDEAINRAPAQTSAKGISLAFGLVFNNFEVISSKYMQMDLTKSNKLFEEYDINQDGIMDFDEFSLFHQENWRSIMTQYEICKFAEIFK